MAFPGPDILAARHRAIRARLTALNLDGLVVTNPINIRYLSNHAGSAGTLVITHSDVHLLIDFRYQESVRSTQASDAACPGLRLWPVPASYDEALIEMLSQPGMPMKVGIEAAHMTVARKDWLERTASSRGLPLMWTSTERVVEQARLVKDANEVAILRDAAARLTFVAERAFHAIRPGAMEREVAAAIETGLRSAGYERPAFDTIVASGPNASLPHYRAGLRILKEGDLVVLDFGGVLDGYCSDLTRTVSVRTPTDDALRLHSAVRDAQRQAIEAVKPGVPAASVDAAARSLLESRGLGEAFGHGTGHGLGLDIHEEPRIGPPRSHSASVQLEPGMVFTIEPGAYVPGLGGVRIEDDVLVTADGYEVLTSVTTELLELG